jgi:hypothetical protein
MHLIFGLACLLSFAWILRGEIPVLVTACIVLSGFDYMEPYLFAPLTEWVSFNMVLLGAGVAYRFLKAPDRRSFCACGFLISVMILTRPSMVVLLAFFPLSLLVRDGQVRPAARLVYSGICLGPVVLWMTFNLIRLGTFTLTPYGGVNIFGLASSIGEAEIRTGDTEDFKLFANYVNEHRMSISTPERTFEEALPERYYIGVYNYNDYRVGMVIALERGWSPVYINSLMQQYAMRVLWKYPGRYCRYIMEGLKILQVGASYMLGALLCALLCLYQRKRCELALVTLGVLGAHVIHTIFTSMVIVTLPRYYDTTLTVIFILFLVHMVAMFLDLMRSDRDLTSGGKAAGNAESAFKNI